MKSWGCLLFKWRTKLEDDFSGSCDGSLLKGKPWQLANTWPSNRVTNLKYFSLKSFIFFSVLVLVFYYCFTLRMQTQTVKFILLKTNAKFVFATTAVVGWSDCDRHVTFFLLYSWQKNQIQKKLKNELIIFKSFRKKWVKSNL